MVMFIDPTMKNAYRVYCIVTIFAIKHDTYGIIQPVVMFVVVEQN